MITNEWIVGTDDLTVPLALRQAVFIDEQHAEGPDNDAIDPLALHLLIRDDDMPIATGRIYHDGASFCLGRCCVIPQMRGQGIGDLLVKLLLLKVFEYGPSEVRIHAQKSAVPFYEHYGFRKVGEPFEEAGIEHMLMTVDKDSLTFPSKCGHDRHFSDFFEEAHA